MALARTCSFCLEPLADCLCEDDEAADASPAGTAPHAVADEDEEPAPPYRGVITIEWPAPFGASPYSAMTGHKVAVTDALTGKPVRTCLRVQVTADMDAIVTADLAMFAGEDGEPLLDGEPVIDGDGFRTGTFPFVVSEMRVRQA